MWASGWLQQQQKKSQPQVRELKGVPETLTKVVEETRQHMAPVGARV